MAAHGVDLHITGLTKRYGDVTALDGIDLTIAAGEFMTLLGPSGSGKTTTLNLIAGFVDPDGGEVFMGGEPLLGLPTYRRDIGVVFQNYALFPHMRVVDNVAFPLRRRKMSKVECARRVNEILEIVGLVHLAQRYPRELSGGQQQRVALARALVFGPKLLLLDEPLGALDKRLREGLQLEIKRIHRELGVTFVFVTHDQEEALAMSDRIAVFNEGRIEQVGQSQEIYENPKTLFTAQFLGDSNVIEGSLSVDGQVSILENGAEKFVAPPSGLPLGARASLVLRPEQMRVIDQFDDVPTSCNALPATVLDTVYLGARRRLLLSVKGQEFLAEEMAPARAMERGQQVYATWEHGCGTLVATDAVDAETTDATNDRPTIDA